MTVAVCHVMPALDVAPRHTRMPMPMPPAPPQQLDMWSAIQTNNTDGCSAKTPALPPPAKARYLAPVRRSMSHESLALCTESLGSETGTRGDFLDQAAVVACLYQATGDHHDGAETFPPPPPASREEEEEEQDEAAAGGALTAGVRYHRARPQRAFPPPLPSMSRRRGDDAGPCLRMRPRRRDGRLVVEAVAAKPQGYLHARRQGGRLRLCFVDCASSSARDHPRQDAVEPQPQQEEEEEVVEEEEVEEDEEEEEEDEVEVVERGTVVEVVAASGKAQRCSRIVINKFVGGAPATDELSSSRCSRASAEEDSAPPAPGMRRVPSSTTTLAAAVAAASTGMDEEEEEEEAEKQGEETSTMLLFTSRVGDRAELVQSVRRCRQLRQRPLFIVEPYTVIAT